MDILDINKIEELSTEIIDIPGFTDGETVRVKVRKPRLLHMLQEGEIPNHLIGLASDMLLGVDPESRPKVEGEEANIELLKNMSKMSELYARACLVEPTYEELEPYITDAQGNAIFEYAIGMVNKLDSFRTDTKDDTDNTDGR